MTNAEKSSQTKPNAGLSTNESSSENTAEVVPSLVVNRVWYWGIMMHYAHCARILVSHFTVRFCCLVAKLSFTTHHKRSLVSHWSRIAFGPATNRKGNKALIHFRHNSWNWILFGISFRRVCLESSLWIDPTFQNRITKSSADFC